MRVAAIVPAYREAERIGRVLPCLLRSPLLSEVIVVDDGSDDGTAQAAGRYAGVTVVRLPENRGKGAAVAAGARLARADVVLLVDADLDGLTPEHVAALLFPLATDRAEMSVGLLRHGGFWSDAGQGVSPMLSGQRAVRRTLVTGAPELEASRMGVELALNEAVRRSGGRVVRVPLRGVGHALKEQKMGWRAGLRARGRMYREIGRQFWRLRRGRASRAAASRTSE